LPSLRDLGVPDAESVATALLEDGFSRDLDFNEDLGDAPAAPRLAATTRPGAALVD
jgi:hypothetical protein